MKRTSACANCPDTDLNVSRDGLPVNFDLGSSLPVRDPPVFRQGLVKGCSDSLVFRSIAFRIELEYKNGVPLVVRVVSWFYGEMIWRSRESSCPSSAKTVSMCSLRLVAVLGQHLSRVTFEHFNSNVLSRDWST